jgi:hypothetical protein
MIRVRRLPPQFLKRRRYEVELTDPGGGEGWTQVTSTPVTLIDKYIGVGDAWSVVGAADAAWDGDVGDWVVFPPVETPGAEP